MRRRIIEIDEQKCNGCGLCAKACCLGEVCAANVDAGDDAVVVNADDYFYLSAVTLYGDLGGIAFSFTVCKSLIAIVDAVVIYRQLFKIRSIGEDGAARFIGGGESLLLDYGRGDFIGKAKRTAGNEGDKSENYPGGHFLSMIRKPPQMKNRIMYILQKSAFLL